MAGKGQIKSRKRVVEHGEVFTNEKEVNAMIDMVNQEVKRLDSRFLEPACGDGNFLIKILEKKLDIALFNAKGDVYLYKKYSLIAVSSIYGVELLPDNAQDCRDRLFKYVESVYKKIEKKEDILYLNSVKAILDLNIICGDALTLLDSEKTPLTFAEWGFHDDFVTRRDFQMATLLTAEAYKIKEPEESNQISLFDDDVWDDVYNSINVPTKVYKDVHFLKIGEAYGK